MGPLFRIQVVGDEKREIGSDKHEKGVEGEGERGYTVEERESRESEGKKGNKDIAEGS